MVINIFYLISACVLATIVLSKNLQRETFVGLLYMTIAYYAVTTLTFFYKIKILLTIDRAETQESLLKLEKLINRDNIANMFVTIVFLLALI